MLVYEKGKGKDLISSQQPALEPLSSRSQLEKEQKSSSMVKDMGFLPLETTPCLPKAAEAFMSK